MKCPICGKEMIQSACDIYSTENPMLMAETQRCECGVVYEYSEGAERYTKNGLEIDADFEYIKYINDLLIKALFQNDLCSTICKYGCTIDTYPDCIRDWCKDNKDFVLDIDKLKKKYNL